MNIFNSSSTVWLYRANAGARKQNQLQKNIKGPEKMGHLKFSTLRVGADFAHEEVSFFERNILGNK